MTESIKTNHIKRLSINILFTAVFFITLYVFYTVIHPLYVFDADDWTYISWRRIAAPTWGAWNPAKVFPETIMPFMGSIAVYFLYPINGDYINSLNYVFAFFTSGFITIYALMFYRLCVRRFGLEQTAGWLLTVVFILFHFFYYCTELSGNEFVFYSSDVNAIYNYSISAILNMTIVFYLLGTTNTPNIFKIGNIKAGLLFAAAYFAVYSNLFHSIVLISFISWHLLQVVFRLIKKDISLKIALQENIFYLVTVLLWFICLLYEANGMRAAEEYGKRQETIESIISISSWINRINYIYLLLSIVVIVTAVVLYFINRKNISNIDMEYVEIIRCILYCILVTAVFLVLLCSITGSAYLRRCDVIISLMLFLMLLIFTSGAYLISKIGSISILLPILILVLPTAIYAFHGDKGRTFKYFFDLEPKEIYELNHDFMKQVINADRAGKTEMSLYVPRWSDSDINWPHPEFFGDRISITMYRHGIIKNKIDTKTEIKD